MEDLKIMYSIKLDTKLADRYAFSVAIHEKALEKFTGGQSLRMFIRDNIVQPNHPDLAEHCRIRIHIDEDDKSARADVYELIVEDSVAVVKL